jgi:hypothetical protein
MDARVLVRGIGWSLLVLGIGACSGVPLEGEPLRPGDIDGRPDQQAVSAQQAEGAEAAAEQPAKPAVEWSYTEVIEAVDTRPLPEGAVGEINCKPFEKLPDAIDVSEVREKACQQLVGALDQPGKLGADAVKGELFEASKSCGVDGPMGRRMTCWSAEGKRLASFTSPNGIAPEYEIYDYDNTPDWADEKNVAVSELRTKRVRPGSNEEPPTPCSRTFYDGNVRYEVRDTDGDGQIDKGSRRLHGPLGQFVRRDVLDANAGEYKPRSIREWNGTSFKEYDIRSGGNKDLYRIGQSDGRGNITRRQLKGMRKSVQEMKYDDEGRLIYQAQKDSPDEEGWDHVQTWKYDARGRLLKETEEDRNGRSVRTIDYGPHGPVSGVYTAAGTPPVQEVWEYDEQGRMLFSAEADGAKKLRVFNVVWNDEEKTYIAHKKVLRGDESAPSVDTVDRNLTSNYAFELWYGCFID